VRFLTALFSTTLCATRTTAT